MTTLSPRHHRHSTFDHLAELPFTIESYDLVGLQRPWSPQFVRHTTVVRLLGGGEVGVGEDVSYAPADHEAFQAAGATLPLSGSFALGTFSERLDELELFPVAPNRENARAHRRWAFESAALDLALRQNGVSLAGTLGRECGPVEFVVSMRLPEPVSAEPVLKRLELYPEMRFKLDVSESWTGALVSELAATGAVVSVDFKAYYEGPAVSGPGDPELYQLVAEGLPDALLEDPALTPATLRVLEPHLARITWDAPFGSVEDLVRLPVRPRFVNVKPSRFGTLRGLLEAYDHLAAQGIQAYGGGQFELGPGRAQIQYLASLFHPDAPNDVAPLGHHEVRAGVPVSPLAPAPSRTGFRWSD
jgi:L-alanine-DL-glutamate epimerase-like enolase superfamily enzyme